MSERLAIAIIYGLVSLIGIAAMLRIVGGF